MDQLGKSVDTTERSSLKLASENIAPESWENLQTLYVGGGGGGQLAPTTKQTSVKFRDFQELYVHQFSTNYFQAWQFY